LTAGEKAIFNPTCRSKKKKIEKAFANLNVVDVVGVSSNAGTRSCAAHNTCGDSVVVSDKLYCSWEIQRREDNPKEEEEVIFLYK
jgi:hypothetical protein